MTRLVTRWRTMPGLRTEFACLGEAIRLHPMGAGLCDLVEVPIRRRSRWRKLLRATRRPTLLARIAARRAAALMTDSLHERQGYERRRSHPPSGGLHAPPPFDLTADEAEYLIWMLGRETHPDHLAIAATIKARLGAILPRLPLT